MGASGVVSPDDFGMTEAGANADHDTAMAKADLDHDGKVSKAELEKGMNTKAQR
jgi:hypothetical protein